MVDPTSTPSFASLLQRFFIEHLRQHREVSPRTIAAYRDTFRLLLLFFERQSGKSATSIVLADLNAAFILAFLDHLERDRNNGARSRNARLAAIRSFLKYAAHFDLSALHIIEQALAIPLKRFDRPFVGFLTREEMEDVLCGPSSDSWVGCRDRALFAMLYNTGARVSEITGMRVGDLNLQAAPSVNLRGKGRKQRTVPLWRATADVMRVWRRRLPKDTDDACLFPNRGGTAMTRSNVAQRLAIAVKSASANHPQLRQRKVSPHTIRHTTAMHLLQSGVDISVIALWLGHESPSTTHTYVQADLSMKERALNRMAPLGAKPGRYQPPDPLLRFLEGL